MSENTEENSLRDELSSAFDEDEDQQNDEHDEELDESDGGTDEESEEEDADSGQLGEVEGSPERSEEEPKPEEVAAKPSREDKAAKEIKPPINYGPEAREVWKNVPSKVKEQIRDREQQMAEAMHNTRTARNTHESVEKLATSYAPIMAAEGTNNPMEAIQGMFQTVAELRMGTPQQSAQKMAQLIGHYGIDISMLDEALSGGQQQQQQPTQNDQLAQMVQQAVAPLYQEREQQQQQQQQRLTQDVGGELQEFAKGAEFLNDVRHTMADLIEVASKQGRKMSFKQAYDTACVMDPQIKGVVDQRNLTQRSAAKANASSSLAANSGHQGGSSQSPVSLRDQIMSAWDDLT